MEFFHEESLLGFLVVCVFVGGGMAWATGSSVATGWKTLGLLAFYVVLLTCVERFLQFALYDGTLLSVTHFLIDGAILAVFAMGGFLLRRREQMKRQYGFLSTK